MKKFISLVLVFAFIFSFVACKKQPKEENTTVSVEQSDVIIEPQEVESTQEVLGAENTTSGLINSDVPEVPSAEPTTAAAPVGNYPVLKLSSDKNTVAPGETVIVFFNISNAEKTACFDVEIDASAGLEYVKAEPVDVAELMIDIGKADDSANSQVLIRGLVATTTDLVDNNLYKMEYKVSDSVKVGDSLKLSVGSSFYQIAEDKAGNDVINVENQIASSSISFTVANS